MFKKIKYTKEDLEAVTLAPPGIQMNTRENGQVTGVPTNPQVPTPASPLMGGGTLSPQPLGFQEVQLP